MKHKIIALSALLVFFSVIVNTATAQDKDKDKKESSLKVKKIKKPKKMTTASGLEYTITQKGNGKKPLTGDKVSVHYTGKLTNDTVFDSSVKRGTPFTFKLGTGAVIKGWDEGIALLQVGDKATFKIPPGLGYGAQSMGIIPSNATLIFDVELLDVTEGPRPYDVKGKDTITTPSGLKYVKVLENKTGTIINAGDKVSVHYSGYLTDGKIFDSSVERGEPISLPIGTGRVIPGWDEGIPLLKKGEKARLIIPPGLGYGDRPSGPIPANSTLIFDVEVVDVKAKVKPVPYDVKGKDTLKTASGLKYQVLSKGNGGIKAEKGKMIKVHYTGYFTDGKIFDSSVERDEPLQIAIGVGQLIPGWDEGILLMNVGDKMRFIVPYQLAYGENGYPGVIPPKSDLIFDVELLEVKDAPQHNSHDGHNH